ncbi:MAG: substrate-binding domain-containing protein [Chthoniobacteraceae bacterium]
MHLRILVCFLILNIGMTPAVETLRLDGSMTVAVAVKEAAPALRTRFDVDFKGSPRGGSTAGIDSVGDGQADLAMSSRALTPQDRSRFPSKDLHECLIGYQALLIAVPLDVWQGGVRAISRQQFLKIYEGKVTNWKEIGGPNGEIKFFNPPRDDGTWDFFATWLYGDVRHAPLGKGFERVRSGRDTRNAVEFFSGAISVTTPNWVDNKRVFPLGIIQDDGKIVEPTTENIRSGAYPIMRPLYLVSGNRPAGLIKKVLDFMTSPEGQEFIKKAEFITISDSAADKSTTR